MAVDANIYRCVNQACGRSWPRQVAFCPYCGRRQAALPFEDAIVAPPLPATAPVRVASPAPPVAPPAPASPPRAKLKVNFGAKPLQIPELSPALADRRNAVPLRQPIRKTTWLLLAIGLAAIWYIAKPPGQRQKLDARIDADIALVGECKVSEARAELSALKSAKASEAQLKRMQEAIAADAPACDKKRARTKAWAEARGVIDAELQYDHIDRAESRLAAFEKKWGAAADTRESGDRIDSKKATQLADRADACLTAGNRVCLEDNLLAAEKLKRPELAQRTLALRDSLSHLLETTLLGSAAPAIAPGATAAAPAPASAPASAPAPAIAPRPGILTTSPAVAQNDQMARRMLADAEHELLHGNYKAAMAKAQQCAALVETGSRECQALWQKANQLNADMQRCQARGAEWSGNRCQ